MSFATCKISAFLLAVIAFISNIAMIIAIRIRNKLKQSIYYNFTCIGVINVIVLLSVPLRMHTELKRKAISNFIVVTIVLLQLQANLALAYDRYLAVSQPMQYRLASTLKRVKRRFFIASIFTIVVAGTTALVGAVCPHAKATMVVVGCARLIAFLLIAISYYLVFKKYKQSQIRDPNDNRSRDPVFLQSREKKEKHLLKMCLGTSLSFIFLNSPLIIAIFIYGAHDVSDDCGTQRGIVLLVCTCLDILNRIFDPLWYFYMEKRKKAANQVAVAHNIAMQNNPSNTRGPVSDKV